MDDREINCAQCQTPFVFTAREQQFYTERGFQEPKRCKACRDNRKAGGGGGGGGSGRAPRQAGGGGGGGGRDRGPGGGGGGGRSGPRPTFPATCAACGQQTEVPFAPKGDRPVYCRDCFRERKPERV